MSLKEELVAVPENFGYIAETKSQVNSDSVTYYVDYFTVCYFHHSSKIINYQVQWKKTNQHIPVDTYACS